MIQRLSIIVPTFNRRAMLNEAIESIRKQSFKPFEIIVVDGGSTDGTFEWAGAQPDLTFVCGPDRGVYDAFNKGIAGATGEVFGILNSDDLYPDGALESVATTFARNPSADAVCGIAALRCNGATFKLYDNPADMALRTPRTSLIGACVPNARFFRRSAAANVGLFDISYRFVSDRDWLTRWYQLGLSMIALPVPVYIYRQHEGSLTFDADRRREIDIRLELMRLARAWRTNKTARPEIARTAELLEGRCRSVLAAHALRHGDLLGLTDNLFMTDGHVSPAPLLSIAHAGIDWVGRRLGRRD